MKSNRLFWIIILVSAATLAAYTGYWYWGAQKLAAFAEEQLDGWRSEAVDVHYAEPAVTGFPGIIRVTFPSVAVTDSKQNWHWQGQQVELSAQPWKPLNFRGSLRGEQGLSLPLDGRMVDMVLSADRADVLTHFDLQGQLSGVELELVKLDGAAPMLDEHVRADYLYLNVDQLAAGGDLAASLRTKVTKLILPKAWDNPLGRGLKEFQAKINIVEPFPQSDLQDSLTRWQANGGRLDINWLKVEWGTLGLQGQGRLALDKDLRLAAAGARLFSFGKTADGRPAADIPIVLQQGNLLLGPLQLASIPPVFAPAKAPVRISPPPEEADRGPVPKELMPPAGDKITPVPTAPVVVEELGPPKAPAAQ